MLLSVQDQFVPKIQDGTKPFSIRAFRKDGRIPKLDETIYMYHGSRYAKGKRPRVFPEGMEPTVKFVGRIEINFNSVKIHRTLHFDLRDLPLPRSDYELKIGEIMPQFDIDYSFEAGIINLDKFCYMDGFNCFADQLAFFEKLYGLPFSGLIIFWKLHPEWLRTRGIQ